MRSIPVTVSERPRTNNNKALVWLEYGRAMDMGYSKPPGSTQEFSIVLRRLPAVRPLVGGFLQCGWILYHISAAEEISVTRENGRAGDEGQVGTDIHLLVY